MMRTEHALMLFGKMLQVVKSFASGNMKNQSYLSIGFKMKDLVFVLLTCNKNSIRLSDVRTTHWVYKKFANKSEVHM